MSLCPYNHFIFNATCICLIRRRCRCGVRGDEERLKTCHSHHLPCIDKLRSSSQAGAFGIIWQVSETVRRYNTFRHSVVLGQVHKPLPKRVIHTVRYSASCFSLEYPVVSFRPSSSCLCPLPCLPATSTLPSIFTSITCFRSSSYARGDQSI